MEAKAIDGATDMSVGGLDDGLLAIVKRDIIQRRREFSRATWRNIVFFSNSCDFIAIFCTLIA